jgi:hypothetical protein
VGVSRFRPRLDELSRLASVRAYRRITELWAMPDRGPDADARLYRIFVRLADRESARGVGLVDILERLPRVMADGIRRALAARLGLTENGGGAPPIETI